MSDAKANIDYFRRDYNSYLPHISLQRKTPEETETEYVKTPEFSTFELSENESRSNLTKLFNETLN